MTAAPDPIWCVVPILSEPYTEQAIADLLDQSVPTRLLLINQGVERIFRERLERIAEADPERIFLWNHEPSLPSLSATWNRALRFCWATGADRALVVNNDIRLQKDTVTILSGVLGSTAAYFVSAVGVTAAQFNAEATWFDEDLSHGGPDFSCFLIAKLGHEKYPFDESFIPAYCEDLDMHRRYMLGGDADKIFSINLPYLHYASGTLKSFAPEKKAAWERRIGQSRAHYAKKWGPGGVNHETYTIPFDPASAQDGVTTPELQAAGR